MLSPFVHVEPGTDEAGVQQSLIKALNHEYGSIARSLEGMFAPLLKNVTEEQAIKRYGELVAICSEAGFLAYNLWSQKTRMDCVRVFGSDNVFHIKSTIMQPHASMLCDHDSHEYDGRPVQLCVEPALIAFGNEQRQDYDKYKIWMPATVWIAEDVPKSMAGKSDERVDVPIKQEVDSDEDSVNAPRRKRVRFGQAAPPAEASKVGTSSNLENPSGERSVNLNATSSSRLLRPSATTKATETPPTRTQQEMPLRPPMLSTTWNPPRTIKVQPACRRESILRTASPDLRPKA
jgi:hypothetical protein